MRKSKDRHLSQSMAHRENHRESGSSAVETKSVDSKGRGFQAETHKLPRSKEVRRKKEREREK